MCAYVCVSCVMRGVGVGTLRLRGSPLVQFVVEGSFFSFSNFLAARAAARAAARWARPPRPARAGGSTTP